MCCSVHWLILKNKFHHLISPLEIALLCTVLNGFSPGFCTARSGLHFAASQHLKLSETFEITQPLLSYVPLLRNIKKLFGSAFMNQTFRYFILWADADKNFPYLLKTFLTLRPVNRLQGTNSGEERCKRKRKSALPREVGVPDTEKDVFISLNDLSSPHGCNFKANLLVYSSACFEKRKQQNSLGYQKSQHLLI